MHARRTHMHLDFDQHGVLRVDLVRQNDPEAGVWRTACFRETASKRQILEFRLLQIYLRIRRVECTVHGRGGSMVGLVHCAWLPKSAQPALQGSI